MKRWWLAVTWCLFVTKCIFQAGAVVLFRFEKLIIFTQVNQNSEKIAPGNIHSALQNKHDNVWLDASFILNPVLLFFIEAFASCWYYMFGTKLTVDCSTTIFFLFHSSFSTWKLIRWNKRLKKCIINRYSIATQNSHIFFYCFIAVVFIPKLIFFIDNTKNCWLVGADQVLRQTHRNTKR